MVTRREFLRSGVAALALGLGTRKGQPGPFASNRLCHATGALPVVNTNPFLALPNSLDVELVDGLPFKKWFTGDDFQNDQIPLHFITDWFNGQGPPAPTEQVEVAVVGGGISGLAAAYLLRDHHPVLFELRDRFGGNALGEVWQGIPFSLGSAYVITPDPGSFLEEFYLELGLDEVARVSLPPDPIEWEGVIYEDFWKEIGTSPEEQTALERYADAVAFMAEYGYPDIPLSDDPQEAAEVINLDRKNFREDVEQRIKMPLPPRLAAAIQGYFYSSFGAPMEEISAASGWNFVAAEEYGRWVFPGGNAYLAWAMWRRLWELEFQRPPECRPYHLRGGCLVIDVRPAGEDVLVTYRDAARRIRSLTAKQVVMAGSKHVCKNILHDLEHWDNEKRMAMNQIPTNAYVVAHVLLDAPIVRDFYDCFLLHDVHFPMDPNLFAQNSRVVDMLRGDFALPPQGGRSVLTLYWPLPWPSARFTLLLDDPWQSYAERLAPQVRAMLQLLEVSEEKVRQVRITRWGHAMPIARPGLIADGITTAAHRTLGRNIHFVNQDNWALPAVENSLLDAQRAATTIVESL